MTNPTAHPAIEEHEPQGLRALVEHRSVRVTQRVLLAVGGGYALRAVIVMLMGWLLAALGMARSEAVTLSMMLGFVLYLVVLIWAFAERRLLRLWLVLGGALLACGLAWTLDAWTRVSG